jgi:hypothetical protein
MSLQYRNKSKSQLTSPTPAQLPAVALSAGHIVCNQLQNRFRRVRKTPHMMAPFIIDVYPEYPVTLRHLGTKMRSRHIILSRRSMLRAEVFFKAACCIAIVLYPWPGFILLATHKIVICMTHECFGNSGIIKLSSRPKCYNTYRESHAHYNFMSGEGLTRKQMWIFKPVAGSQMLLLSPTHTSTHHPHAEGLVNPKVRAQKPRNWF